MNSSNRIVPVKNSHCGFCGSKFAEQVLYPRRCWTCMNDTYTNPLPVVAVLLPVLRRNSNSGTLIQKRNIEPKKDCWALTSGYLNCHETWQQAAARETLEEVGLTTDPSKYLLSEIRNSDSGNLIIFGSYNEWIKYEDIKFVSNEEVSEIKIINSPCELAFPTHTAMLAKYFESSWIR
jgi:NADH pyrophosphatase NudC (nudix superfamily)